MSNDIDNLEGYIPDAVPEHLEKFRSFFEVLSVFNKKINLISKATVSQAGVKHFADCHMAMTRMSPLFKDGQEVFDFGAGNGFPGIIAAIMEPSRHIIMVERDQRKSEFLKAAIDHLSLPNAEVYAGNVSHLAEGVCNTIISRAMAPLPKFLLEARQVTKVGGAALLMKGESWSSEFSAIPAQLFEFWDVSLKEGYYLPNDAGARYIVECVRV